MLLWGAVRGAGEPGDDATRTAMVGEFCIGPDDGGEDPDSVFFPTGSDSIAIADAISLRCLSSVDGRTAELPLGSAALCALLGYDAMIRSHGSVRVIAAVAGDEDGEVFDEVLDVARGSGVDTSALEDSAVFVQLVGLYQKLIAEEPRSMPAAAADGS